MRTSPDSNDLSSENRDPDPEALRGEAARCRRLASSALDRRTLDALNAMACEYEEKAARMNEAG